MTPQRCLLASTWVLSLLFWTAGCQILAPLEEVLVADASPDQPRLDGGNPDIAIAPDVQSDNMSVLVETSAPEAPSHADVEMDALEEPLVIPDVATPPDSAGPDGGCRTCGAPGESCGVQWDGCKGVLDCGSCTAPLSCGGSGAPNACGCTKTTCSAEGRNCGSLSDKCGGTLDCGTCALPDTCGGASAPNVCGCTVKTCTTLGKNCGPVGDGCGGTLNCGTCTPPLSCGGGTDANVCACTPTTCTAQGKNCGIIVDGCGGTLNCGGCSGTGQSCGGGGVPNVCAVGVCSPKTCGELGKNCGSIGDGCSGSLSCGSCAAGQTCGGAGTANVCGCTPTTCAGEGKNCGSIPDKCGGTLNCGACTAPLSCGGSGSGNVCGCSPTTCDAQGKNCGSISDGCGGTLNCGTCTPPNTCSGAGNANMCGCAPTTCAAEGKNCGSIPDGCGGTLVCGACAPPLSCGAGGVGNVCGCSPSTCAALGKNCGSIADGCGGTLNCGTCSSPASCGGGGAANVCGCIPTSCAAQGKSCGTIGDNCGNTLDCGGCMAPQFCSANVCAQPSCQDGLLNGNETDKDCGGSCPKCAVSNMCKVPADCQSGICLNGICQPPPELCTNGVDDDGDGKIDCADPDCGAFSCASVPPSGWTGPIELYDGPASNAPNCNGYFSDEAYRGNDGLSCADAQCSSCSCGPPVKVVCTAPVVSFYLPKDLACRDLAPKQINTTPGVCQDVGLTPPLNVAVSDSQPTGGGCAASGGVPALSSVTWKDTGVVCQPAARPAQGGCATGNVCMLAPKSPFVSSVCIYQAGDQACPDPYLQKHIFFENYHDDRGCSPCSCDDPKGVNCPGQVDMFPGKCDLLGKLASFRAPTACASSPYATTMAYTPGRPSGGSCGTSGVAPTGGCAGTTPTTVCCH